MKKLFVFAALGLLYSLGCSDSLAEQLRDGDIIFETSRSEQSIAIQKATGSQYSHMGIVFFKNEAPHVYEAITTVQHTPLGKWVDRGEGGHYVVKRLREADQIITLQTVKKLQQPGANFRVTLTTPTLSGLTNESTVLSSCGRSMIGGSAFVSGDSRKFGTSTSPTLS